MARVGRAIPTKCRHPPPCQRATAAQISHRSRPQRRPAAPRPSPVALADRDARLREAGIPAAPIVALSRPFEDPVPSELAEQIDLVTLMFNYHDLGHLGVDRAAMNRAVFRRSNPEGYTSLPTMRADRVPAYPIRHPASDRRSLSSPGSRSGRFQAR